MAFYENNPSIKVFILCNALERDARVVRYRNSIRCHHIWRYEPFFQRALVIAVNWVFDFIKYLWGVNRETTTSRRQFTIEHTRGGYCLLGYLNDWDHLVLMMCHLHQSYWNPIVLPFVLLEIKSHPIGSYRFFYPFCRILSPQSES